MGKYFTARELSRSAEARKRGIDNTPPPEAERCMEALIAEVLDPLRQAWGKPITVNSGYRCPELNRAVGGVWNSNHLSGEAADLAVESAEELERMAETVVRLGLPFDELLLERNGAGAMWLHVAYRKDGNNRYKKRYVQGK